MVRFGTHIWFDLYLTGLAIFTATSLRDALPNHLSISVVFHVL
jgi:hypothetical protein